MPCAGRHRLHPLGERTRDAQGVSPARAAAWAAADAIRSALKKARGSDPDEYVAHLHLAIAGSVLPDGLADLATAWSSSNDAQAALAGALESDGTGAPAASVTGR